MGKRRITDIMLKEMCKIINGSELNKNAHEFEQGTKIISVTASPHDEKKVMCLRVMANITEHEPLAVEQTRECAQRGKGGKEGLPYVEDMEKIKEIPCVGVSNIQRASINTGAMMYKSVELSKFMFNDGEFQTLFDGKLYYQGEEVMNCVICIDHIVASDKRTCYECSVYINGKIYHKTIQANIFFTGLWLQDSIPGFATSVEKNKAMKLIYKYLNCLVKKTQGKNICNQCNKPGWTEHERYMIYVTPDGTIPNVGLQIVSVYGQRFGNVGDPERGNVRTFLSMARLTPRTWTAPIILLYDVMCFSYSLYKKAGLLPKFLLFLNGKRGCYKTSLSLLMTQIERRDSPEYSLKATAAGIEAGYRKYKDAVMLVDDLAPCTELRELNNMKSNVERLVRAFGDGTGIKRNFDFCDSDKDLEQYEAEGGAIITGEFVTGCESSLARCLILPLARADVDVMLMTELQKDEGLLPNFMAKFIEYLAMNYQGIVSYISERGKHYRTNLNGKFSNARYGEYYAQLAVAAELLVQKYGYETGQLSQADCDQQLEVFMYSIQQAIEYNDHALMEESPITLLCRAIIMKIDSNMFAVVPKNSKVNNEIHHILETEDAYYIRAEDIYAMKNSYDHENGIFRAEYKAATLANMLCDAGIARRIHEGKTVRTGRKIGNARYVEINKKKLFEQANL